MDKLDFRAEVKDIKWVTNTKGQVNPIICLDKKYKAVKEDDEQTFDGIVFLSYNSLAEHKCGIGSKIKIKCTDQLVPEINETIKPSTEFKLPKKCMYCGAELKSFNQDFMCINHLCIAQGRTPIFKLFMASTLEPVDRARVVDIHLWLNHFPSNGDYSRIENFYEFLKLFKQEFGNIGSDQRRDELLHKVGRGGGGIFMYEIAIKQNLKNGLTPDQFWYILGLPFKDSDYKKISKWDAVKNGMRKAPKLSDHGNQVLFDNMPFIKLILKTLRNFK